MIIIIKKYIFTGFARVMENLERHGILKKQFPGLESHGFYCLVMENNRSWSWKMNKLYQIKDDLDFFQKKFRFDKNLALSKLRNA